MNCGAEILDGAKFCQKCGTPVTNNIHKENAIRQQEFAGKIYKCPNCGEVLKSFTSNCPACGFELRGIKATSAVKEFAVKLEAIEARREYKKPGGLFKRATATQEISKTDEQKVSLIKNFAVPNTKEDILEFMILATSNIDMDIYGTTNTPTAGAKALTDAWNAKIKQVYIKAKNLFGTDNDFQRIQELYDSCNNDIKKHKKKKIIKWVLFVGWIPLLWIIIIVGLVITEPKDEAKELERLNAIVVEVQDALDKAEYKLALNIADSIDYQRYDVEMERKWDIERAYWIDKVIEEAEKNGVTLEYTSSEDIDKANDDSSSTPSRTSFVEGAKEGMKTGLDDAKENIDEFNRIMNNEETDSGNSQEGE